MIQLRDHPLSPTKSWRELAAAMREDGRAGTTLARLSPAERLVAVHLLEGMTNREIAQALGKSVCTVKNQVSAILAKLNAPRRGRVMAMVRTSQDG